MRRKSEKSYQGDEDVFSEYSTGGIEAGQRILWCHLPSVRNSGVLQNLEPRERKRQEVWFSFGCFAYFASGMFPMFSIVGKRVLQSVCSIVVS